MRFHTVASLSLRGDSSGRLTMDQVRRARFDAVRPGGRVLLNLINVTSWSPGAPEKVGAILRDLRAGDVEVQGNFGQIDTFREMVEDAALNRVWRGMA